MAKGKFGLSVRPVTLGFLAFVAVILGVYSILVDFNVLPAELNLSMVVTGIYVGLIFFEVSASSILKRNVGALEIIGLSAVFLTLVAMGLTLAGITSEILSGAAGVIKAFLIIIAIAMVFSKQPGE